MNLKKIDKAELELLSYCDIAALLIKENKKPLNTPSIFKEICNLLEYSDNDYTNKIGDFYASMTTDKRFILLDTAEWDLRDNHAIKISIDDDDVEEEIVDDEENDETEEEETDSIEEPIDDEELDIDDDNDIDDLMVVDGDEEEIDL